MYRRLRRRPGVALPWEERGTWLRQLFAGSRWRIVVAAMAILAIAWGLANTAEQRARVRRTRAAIADVHNAVADFRKDVGRCPRSMVELVHPPRSGSRYLRETPRDGYGRALWFRCPGVADPDAVDVISAGPSGSFLVDDNIQ